MVAATRPAAQMRQQQQQHRPCFVDNLPLPLRPRRSCDKSSMCFDDDEELRWIDSSCWQMASYSYQRKWNYYCYCIKRIEAAKKHRFHLFLSKSKSKYVVRVDGWFCRLRTSLRMSQFSLPRCQDWWFTIEVKIGEIWNARNSKDSVPSTPHGVAAHSGHELVGVGSLRE